VATAPELGHDPEAEIGDPSLIGSGAQHDPHTVRRDAALRASLPASLGAVPWSRPNSPRRIPEEREGQGHSISPNGHRCRARPVPQPSLAGLPGRATAPLASPLRPSRPALRISGPHSSTPTPSTAH